MANERFNLLTDPWIPVRCRFGAERVIAVGDLFDPSDPPTEIVWGRADFDVAQLEFLIAVLAVTHPPEDQEAWLDLMLNPPSPEEVQGWLAPFAPAFCLDGDGPRFMQVTETEIAGRGEKAAAKSKAAAEARDGAPPRTARQAENRVETLLFGAPGESTEGRNRDLFVKRRQVSTLGRPAAAIALYTLQSYAGSGGAGNRVSWRGGGPLVTYVVPRTSDGRPTTLREIVWANVPCGTPAAPDDSAVFPWMAPLLDAEGAGNRLDPRQAWFNVPRLMRLSVEPAGGNGAPCDLTGRIDAFRVQGWRQRPRSHEYALRVEPHPLTPHYPPAPDDKATAHVHANSDRIGYQHWLGLVFSQPSTKLVPARVVRDFRQERYHLLGLDGAPPPLLVASGVNLANMDVLGYVESTMPMFMLADPEANAGLEAIIGNYVLAAYAVRSLLIGQIISALYRRIKDAKRDSSQLAAASDRFFDRTQADFFEVIGALCARLRADTEADTTAEAQRWLDCMTAAAIGVFDEMVPLQPLAGRLRTESEGQPPVHAALAARKWLVLALKGVTKPGRGIYEQLKLTPAAPPDQMAPTKMEETAS